jgi:CspA family cold shock protein
MILQWCCKGIPGLDEAHVRHILPNGEGILCALRRMYPEQLREPCRQHHHPIIGQTGVMADGGVVREFDVDEGWGVIDGATVPGGCWVHFSAIAADGFRQLTAGQPVSFRAEAAEQDGFHFRAVQVWTENVEPIIPPRPSPLSDGAYQSVLTLRFDAPDDQS